MGHASLFGGEGFRPLSKSYQLVQRNAPSRLQNMLTGMPVCHLHAHFNCFR